MNDATNGHVFISYVREDSERVDQLQQVLEASGVAVWRDVSSIWPGQDWRARIRHAINDEALAFIACFSQASIQRRASYQNEELSLAIDELRRRRPDDTWFIPVRFDECDIPNRELGGGRTLKSIQSADIFGDHADSNIERLVASLKQILGHSDHIDVDLAQMTPGRVVIIADHGSAAANSIGVVNIYPQHIQDSTAGGY